MKATVTRKSVFYVTSAMGEIGPFHDGGFAQAVAERLNDQDARAAALMAVNAPAADAAPPMVDLNDLTGFQAAMARNGFSIEPNGGGLTAWTRPIAVKAEGLPWQPHIMITDTDGSSHTKPDGEPWMAGFHWPEELGLGMGYTVDCVEFATNLDLIKGIRRYHDVAALAFGFALKLREWHDDSQWAAMRHANAIETDKGICHSHDFCDANEAMIHAFETLFNRSQFFESDVDQWEEFTAANREEHARLAAEDLALVSDAWDFAKRMFLSEEWNGDTTAALTASLNTFCDEFGLPHECAEELIATLNLNEAPGVSDRLAWLNRFIAKWQVAEDYEDALRKTRVQPEN